MKVTQASDCYKTRKSEYVGEVITEGTLKTHGVLELMGRSAGAELGNSM